MIKYFPGPFLRQDLCMHDVIIFYVKIWMPSSFKYIPTFSVLTVVCLSKFENLFVIFYETILFLTVFLYFMRFLYLGF